MHLVVSHANNLQSQTVGVNMIFFLRIRYIELVIDFLQVKACDAGPELVSKSIWLSNKQRYVEAAAGPAPSFSSWCS
jgi:hypothetical protein